MFYRRFYQTSTRMFLRKFPQQVLRVAWRSPTGLNRRRAEVAGHRHLCVRMGVRGVGVRESVRACGFLREPHTRPMALTCGNTLIKGFLISAHSAHCD